MNVKVILKPHAQGFSLISALLILLIVTVLGISLFRGNTLFQKLSSNTREKELAFQAAQTALQYAENWLQSATVAPGFGKDCSKPNPTPAILDVCDVKSSLPPLGSAGSAQDPNHWTFYSTYTPYGMKVASTAGTTKNENNNTVSVYSQAPRIYIQYLGKPDPGSDDRLYQITAAGFGADANTIVVVQSTALRQPNSEAETPPPD